MSIVSKQVLENILDHLDSSKLDLDAFSDKDLLKLILYMLLEQRKKEKDTKNGSGI